MALPLYSQTLTEENPFGGDANVTVLLFVRSDCPITKRYAPELGRISQAFARQPVRFWLVFPDGSETPATVQGFIDQYHLPGTALSDRKHLLARRARVTVAPEAAVFARNGALVYHGRIDDRYVDIGKSRPAAQVHDLEDAIGATLAGKPVAHSETRAVGCYLADLE